MINKELLPLVLEILENAEIDIADFRSNNIGQNSAEYEASEEAQKLIKRMRIRMEKSAKKNKARKK